ncbi:MAG: type II secretion system protein GspM [Geminicoccaceae bacterium]
MLRPGSLISRLLALALLAAVPVLGYLFVVGPVIAAYRDAGEAIAQAQRLLHGYRERAEQRPQLAQLLAAEEARAGSVTGYLDAVDDALAAAELQVRLKGVVEAAGGELRSAQSLKVEPVDAVDGVRRAGLKVRFSADVESLATILYDLETGEPYLFVDALSIREPRRQRRRRDAPEEAPQLDVMVDLYGYVRDPQDG